MKKIFIFIFIIALSISATAQEKPFRIGLKVGVPNIIGLNIEYVTPLLDGKLAATLDYSKFSFTAEGVEIDYSYFEIGTNYYFKKKGRGLYGHISYGKITVTGTYTDVNLGTGSAKMPFSMMNFKLGAKLGKGFYFRTELGYGIVFSGMDKVDVKYTDPAGFTTTEEVTVPSLVSGGPIVNIGIGIAF